MASPPTSQKQSAETLPAVQVVLVVVAYILLGLSVFFIQGLVVRAAGLLEILLP